MTVASSVTLYTKREEKKDRHKKDKRVKKIGGSLEVPALLLMDTPPSADFNLVCKIFYAELGR